MKTKYYYVVYNFTKGIFNKAYEPGCSLTIVKNGVFNPFKVAEEIKSEKYLQNVIILNWFEIDEETYNTKV